jgi:hypothetical protein
MIHGSESMKTNKELAWASLVIAVDERFHGVAEFDAAAAAGDAAVVLPAAGPTLDAGPVGLGRQLSVS